MIPQSDKFYNRYTARHKHNIEKRLTQYANWLKENRNIDNIANATYDDVYEFFEKSIKPRGCKVSTCEKWRSLLKTYYEFLIEYQQMMRLPVINNPVPSKKWYRFSEPQTDEKEFEQKFLTYPVIERVLRYWYFNNSKMYYLMSLIAYSGARVSEVCTIKTADIDLKNRKWISGRIPGFAKRGKVIFFFPEFFAKSIKFSDYVKERQNDETNAFLFPSERSRNKVKSKYEFISPATIRNRQNVLKKYLKISEPINPHSFRDCLNTERESLRILNRDLDLLLNQKPEGVNRQNYMKRFKDWRELRQKYDKFFPYPIFRLLY